MSIVIHMASISLNYELIFLAIHHMFGKMTIRLHSY